MNSEFNQVDSVDYSKIKSQKFNGVDVWFGPSTDNDVMIFVTDVIKMYPNKNISNFLSNKSTQRLLDQVSSELGIPKSQLIVQIRGNYSDGRPQGTWMHKKIALAFAMWLDPVFYSWCIDKLIELLTYGSVSMDNEWFGQASYSNPQVQDIINQLQQENQQLKQENNNLWQTVNNQQPQVDYYNQILNQHPNNSYTTKDILVQIGARISSKDFIKMLINNGYASRVGKTWQLKSPWCKNRLRTTDYRRCVDGVIRPVLRWSEAGKHFVWMLAKDWNLV